VETCSVFIVIQPSLEMAQYNCGRQTDTTHTSGGYDGPHYQCM